MLLLSLKNPTSILKRETLLQMCLGCATTHRRAQLRGLVTQVGAIRCWDVGLTRMVGLGVALIWPAHSKRGVGPRDLGEGLGQTGS